jgi:hypothetical protein
MGARKRINIGLNTAAASTGVVVVPRLPRKDDTLHAEAESCSHFPVQSFGHSMLAASAVTWRYRSGTAVAPAAQGLFYTASHFVIAAIAVHFCFL